MTVAAEKLEKSGCEIFEYRLDPAYGRVHDLHDTIYRRALAYYFKLEWSTHAELFSPIMQEMICGGMQIAPEAYAAAVAEQQKFQRRFDADSADFDVLICPSTAEEAPIGLEGRDLPDHCLIWTFVGAPVIGIPALSGSSGLPVGLQVVARRYDDYKLLAFAEFASGVLVAQ
jgi:Asp-tRNA(Asn)/Glu-tRNA(Gln) amidotransferase A subunit family amidase